MRKPWAVGRGANGTWLHGQGASMETMQGLCKPATARISVYEPSLYQSPGAGVGKESTSTKHDWTKKKHIEAVYY